jgi:N-hydroxyarylamine O-acetyltransferase
MEDMDTTVAERYLERIGVTGPVPVDHDGLTLLMARHLATVPFENLSIHLSESILLAEDALITKIVDRRRGGFCYELNGAFALLLEHLGFQVTLLAARVFGGTGLLGPPFDHMTLRVELERPWLVDVGFGRFVTAPVLLDERGDQSDPAGTVRIEPAPRGDLDVILGGQPQFRIEQRSRDLEEFAATCWFQQTSPSSHFATSLICSLPTPDGRLTLSDRLLITTVGGVRTEQELGSDAEVLAAYRDHFGIEIDRLPTSPGSAARLMSSN